MKRIMILGASILQKPAIDKAREMGLEVVAVDMDQNAVGFRIADICLPISTIDIPNVVRAAKEYRVEGVMTLASDMPMRTVAAVASECGLVGIDMETAIRATDKAVMRQCLKDHHVPVPKFFKVNARSEYDDAIRAFLARCIVKPTDNSGSRGVFLVENTLDGDAVDAAFRHSKEFSRGGDIIVEEYMEGPEVSVETISLGGVVHILQITDKLTTGAPYFVEMGHSQPTQLPREVAEDIARVTVMAVKAIGIENGPSHTEIMATRDGAKVVELGARLGGDCITTHLVPLSTGIDMVKCCIEIAMGKSVDISKKFEKGSAIRYLDSYNGALASIKGVAAARSSEGIVEVEIVRGKGDVVRDIRASSDRIGFVISQGCNARDAVAKAERAKSLVKTEIVHRGCECEYPAT